MHKINCDKAQKLTRVKLWRLEAEVPNVVPGEERGGALLLLAAAAASTAICRQTRNAIFAVHLFL